jgi:flagellar basal-body rod protein FlgB
MLISDLFNAGAAPSLEHLIRFSGQRQRIIAHNIANISTPDFRPMDLSVADFQKNLKEAIDRRRTRTGGEQGRLDWQETEELQRNGDSPSAGFRANPQTPMKGVLFHDRNNRDPERLMQSAAENVAAFRMATDLLRKHNETIRAAISQRP